MALIEIMIGGPMVGAARQGGGRKGRSELGNERTWPSGSALSRKPSRRSGPIKRPPPFLLCPPDRVLSFQLNFSIWPPDRTVVARFSFHPALLIFPFFFFRFRIFHGVEEGNRIEKIPDFLKIYVHEEKCRLGFRS